MIKKKFDITKEKTVTPKSVSDWRNWLKKNHLKETKVHLIKHKKHTGKFSLINTEAMREAICFGWIDTTIRRIDDERYSQCFVRRNQNSKWSDNTLRYGKELLKEGKMSPFGLKMYKEGLNKKTHDHGIPKDPDMPLALKKELDKNVDIKKSFDKISPSMKRMYYRMILRAKREETINKRVSNIVKMCEKKNS
jgi:uncharacterized protein YdeI (YjbR/CyaY-like superfamily)